GTGRGNTAENSWAGQRHGPPSWRTACPALSEREARAVSSCTPPLVPSRKETHQRPLDYVTPPHSRQQGCDPPLPPTPSPKRRGGEESGSPSPLRGGGRGEGFSPHG